MNFHAVSSKTNTSTESKTKNPTIKSSETHFGHKEVLKDAKLILSYNTSTAETIRQSILQYFVDEFHCKSSAILSIIPPSEEFTALVAHQDSEKKVKYKTNMFTGVLESLTSTEGALIFNQNCDPWKQIFQFIPTYLILIPVLLPLLKERGKSQMKQNTKAKLSTSNINTISVLAFENDKLPIMFLEEYTWSLLVAVCKLNAPLLVNAQNYVQKFNDYTHLDRLAHAIIVVEKEIQDLTSCVKAIGYELTELFGVSKAVVYALEDDMYDPLVIKYETIGVPIKSLQCPDKQGHVKEMVHQTTFFPAGWCALNKQTLVINDNKSLESVCGSKGPLHSLEHCLVNNMMCVYIHNETMDLPLVIELCDKEGGFSAQDEKDAKIFAARVAAILSTANLLEYRKNAIRRHDITNMILSNISKVHYTKVKHYLNFQFQATSAFTKKFYTTKFSFSNLPKEQYAGVILYMFTDLHFIKRWNMRRSTVIRFILSLRQGYVDNAYHNWNHACTVTHFAFYILKKMELQKHGFLKDIEALSFIIACLCHDVAHRGLNNHFSVFAHKDTHHFQSQEDSLLERHHVAVALQILSTEDCNIAENLSDAEYKELLELIQWNIIATDIGKYLFERHDSFATMKKFSKRKKEHRKVFLALLMTMCDLCESIKPWNEYILTVKNIFSEFFEQGDEEIKFGFIPTPIMDRRIAYIPYIELKFLSEIVRPVYEYGNIILNSGIAAWQKCMSVTHFVSRAIAKILPSMKDCVFKIDYHKELWLVATATFDKYSHLHNILQVLDKEDMKEVNLMNDVYPELEKQAAEIRKTVQFQNNPLLPPTPSFLLLGRLDTQSSVQIKSSAAGSEGSLYEWEVQESRMQRCKKSFLEVCCCFKCRYKALYDAHYIRMTHFEAEFMEIRSEEYESIRIDQFFDGEYTTNQGKNPREKIKSLISPEITEPRKSKK